MLYSDNLLQVVEVPAISELVDEDIESPSSPSNIKVSQNISNNVTGPAEAGHVTRPNAENKVEAFLLLLQTDYVNIVLAKYY